MLRGTRRPGTFLPRRQLLRSGAQLSAAGALAAALGACSGSNNKPATVQPPSASRAAGTAGPGATPATAQPVARATIAAATPAPKRGGTLQTAQVSDLLFNGGYPFAIGVGIVLLETVHEPLLRYRDSLQPEPVLAEKLEYNADRTAVTVTLRQGLTFHNGQPVTPEDVFFGLDVIQNPQSHGINGSSQLLNFVKMITGQKKIDQRTFQFTLDKPRGNFTDMLAQLAVVQASTFPSLISGKDVQGTGPYKFVSWNPGQGYRLEPNNSWWGTPQFGGPWLDAITCQQFADYDAVGLAYESGSLDWTPVSPAVAKPYQSKGQTRVGHKTGVSYIAANVTNPQLKDPRVRQALFYALDRNRLANEVQEGFVPVTSQPWPDGSPAFDPALEAPLYNPQKAKQLLQAAGFTQNKPLVLDYYSPQMDAFVAVAKENYAAVGINVDLKPSELNAFLPRWQARQLPDLWVGSHSFADLSPVTLFQQAFPYRIPNASYYESPDYLDIIAKLEALDPLSDAAKAQYKRFNQLWLDDPFIFPTGSTFSDIYLVKPTMHGFDGPSQLTFPNTYDFGQVWKG